MTKLLVIALLVVGVNTQAARRDVGSLTTWIPQVVPLVIAGEGWSQRIILSNVDKKIPAIGTVSFYTKDGAPWVVNLKDRGRGSTFQLNLLPGQTVI